MYRNNRINPSLRLTFFPVLRKKKNNRAEIIIKNLATAKVEIEKLEISIGAIKATIPRISVAGIMTAPIISPKINQPWSFFEEIKAK